MSDDALETMKAEFVKVNLSKFDNEEEVITKPSQDLEDNTEISKYSEEKEKTMQKVMKAFKRY